MLRLLLIAVSLLALAAPAAAVTQQTSLPDLEDEVMCPTCGVPLSQAFSPQAERERKFIQAQIEAGKTKQQVKDALVAEFGEQVLATPRKHGFELTAYVVPVVAVVVALLAVAAGLLRWRRRARPASEPVTKLSGADASRLERDLSRYDA